MPENRLALIKAFPTAFIFNKPRGISCVNLRDTSVADDERVQPTAVSLACEAHPELVDLRTGKADRPNEHGLLHRLDRETTGCLAFARTHEAYQSLRNNWPEAQKIYRAIVFDPDGLWVGRPLPLTFGWPLAASAKSRKRMLAIDPDRPDRKGILRSVRGNLLPAQTEILSALPLNSIPNGVDLTLQIRTGVRHQIRAHLAALGTPLYRDSIYGLKGSHPRSDAAWGLFFLHAWRLALPGCDGVEAPLPPGWPL